MSTGGSTVVMSMSGTSPASAVTAAVATTLSGLSAFDSFTIDAALTGATGGVLDVVIQRKVATDVWVEWVRFTTVSAAAALAYQSISPLVDGKTTATAVGVYTDAGVGTMTLASGTSTGGHPGDMIRMVFVGGTSTSAGAVQTVYVTGHASQ